MHYSHGPRVRPTIFWHKDDAPNDGNNERPVVSISLGETCRFRLMHGWSFAKQRAAEEEGRIHDGIPRAGNAVVFGGACRHIHHTVQAVHCGTCPAALADILGASRLPRASGVRTRPRPVQAAR